MLSLRTIAQLVLVATVLYFFEATLFGSIVTIMVNIFMKKKLKNFKIRSISLFPFVIADFELTLNGGSKSSPEITVRWKKFSIGLDVSKLADPFLDLLLVLPHDTVDRNNPQGERGKIISLCFEEMYIASTEFSWDLFLAAGSGYGGATPPSDGSPDVFAGDPPPTSNGLIIKKVMQRALLYLDLRMKRVDFNLLFPWDACSIVGYANSVTVKFLRPPAEKASNIFCQVVFKHGDVTVKQNDEQAVYFMGENVGATVDYFIPAGMMDVTGYLWESDNPEQPNEAWVTIAPFLELYRRFGLAEDKGIEVKLTRDLITNGKMRICGECEFVTVHVRDYRIEEEVVFDLWSVSGGLKTHMLTTENERLWCGKLVVQDDFSELKDVEQMLEENKKLGTNVTPQDVVKLERNVEKLYKLLMMKNPGQRRLKRGLHKDKTMSINMKKLDVRINNDPNAASRVENLWFKKAQRVNNSGTFIDDDYIDIGAEAVVLQRADAWLIDWLLVAIDAIGKVPSSNFTHRKNSYMTFDFKKIIFSTQSYSFTYNPPSPDSVPDHADPSGEFKTEEQLKKHREFVESLQLSAMSSIPIDDNRWMSLSMNNVVAKKVRKFDNLDSFYDVQIAEVQVETLLPVEELEFQYNISVGNHVDDEDDESQWSRGDGITEEDDDIEYGEDVHVFDEEEDSYTHSSTFQQADSDVENSKRNKTGPSEAIKSKSFSDMMFDDLYVPTHHYDRDKSLQVNNENPLHEKQPDDGKLSTNSHAGDKTFSATRGGDRRWSGTRWTVPGLVAQFQMGEKTILHKIELEEMKIEFSNSNSSSNEMATTEEETKLRETEGEAYAAGSIAPLLPLSYHPFLTAHNTKVIWGTDGKKLIHINLDKLSIKLSAAGAIKCLCAFDIIKRAFGRVGARMTHVKNNAHIIDAAVQWTESGNYEIIAAYRYNVDTTKSSPGSGMGGVEVDINQAEIEIPVDMPIGYHLTMRNQYNEQMELMKQLIKEHEAAKRARNKPVLPRSYRKFSWQGFRREDGMAFASPLSLSSKDNFFKEEDDVERDYRQLMVDRSDKTMHIFLTKVYAQSHNGEMLASLDKCTTHLNCFPEEQFLCLHALKFRTIKAPLQPEDMIFKSKQYQGQASSSAADERQSADKKTKDPATSGSPEKNVTEVSLDNLELNLSARMELNLISDALMNQVAVFGVASKPPPPEKLARKLSIAGKVPVFYSDSLRGDMINSGEPCTHISSDRGDVDDDGEGDLVGKAALDAAAATAPSCTFAKIGKIVINIDAHYRDEYIRKFCVVNYGSIDLALDSTLPPSDVHDEITTIDLGMAENISLGRMDRPPMFRNSSVGSNSGDRACAKASSNSYTPYTQYVLKRCVSSTEEGINRGLEAQQGQLEADEELHAYCGVSGGYLNVHFALFQVFIKDLGCRPFLEIESFGFSGPMYSASITDPRIVYEELLVNLSDTVPVFDPDIVEDLDTIANHFSAVDQSYEDLASLLSQGTDHGDQAAGRMSPPKDYQVLDANTGGGIFGDKTRRRRKSSVASIASINSTIENRNHSCGFVDPIYATISKSSCTGKVYMNLLWKGSTIEVHHHPSTAECISSIGAVVDCVLPVNRDPSPSLPPWDLLRYLCHGSFSMQFDQIFLNSHATDFLGHPVLLRVNTAKTELYLDNSSVELSAMDIRIDAEMANPDLLGNHNHGGLRASRNQWTKLFMVPAIVFALRHRRDVPPMLSDGNSAANESSKYSNSRPYEQQSGGSDTEEEQYDGDSKIYSHHDVYLRPALLMAPRGESNDAEQIISRNNQTDGESNIVSLGLESQIKYLNNDKYYHFRSKKYTACWDIEIRLADTEDTPVWIFLRIEQLVRILDALKGDAEQQKANKSRSVDETRSHDVGVVSEGAESVVLLDKVGDYNKGVKRPPSTVSLGQMISKLQVEVVLNKVMCSTWPSSNDLGGITLIQDRSDMQLRMLRVIPAATKQRISALRDALQGRSVSSEDLEELVDGVHDNRSNVQKFPLRIDHFYYETAFMEIYVRNWYLGGEGIDGEGGNTNSTVHSHAGLYSDASAFGSSRNIGFDNTKRHKSVGEPNNAVDIAAAFQPIHRLAHGTKIVITLSDLGEVAAADQRNFVASGILLTREEKRLRSMNKQLGNGRNKVAEKRASCPGGGGEISKRKDGKTKNVKSKLRKQLINFDNLDYLKEDEEDSFSISALGKSNSNRSVGVSSNMSSFFMIGAEFREYCRQEQRKRHNQHSEEREDGNKKHSHSSLRRTSVLSMHIALASEESLSNENGQSEPPHSPENRRLSIMSFASSVDLPTSDDVVIPTRRRRSSEGTYLQYYIDAEGVRHVRAVHEGLDGGSAADSKTRGMQARKRMTAAIKKVARAQLLQKRVKERANSDYVAVITAFERNHLASKPPIGALPSSQIANHMRPDFLLRQSGNQDKEKKDDSTFGDKIWGVRIIDCRFLSTLSIRDTLTAYITRTMELMKKLNHDDPETNTTGIVAASSKSNTGIDKKVAMDGRKSESGKATVNDFLMRSVSLQDKARIYEKVKEYRKDELTSSNHSTDRGITPVASKPSASKRPHNGRPPSGGDRRDAAIMKSSVEASEASEILKRLTPRGATTLSNSPRATDAGSSTDVDAPIESPMSDGIADDGHGMSDSSPVPTSRATRPLHRIPSIIPLAHEDSIQLSGTEGLNVDRGNASNIASRQKSRDFKYFFKVQLIDPQLNFLDTKTHSSLIIVSESSVVEGRRFKYAALPPVQQNQRKKTVANVDPKRKQDVRLQMEKVEAYTVSTMLGGGDERIEDGDMIHWRRLPSTITKAKDVQELFINGAGELGAGISSTSFAQHSDREVEQSKHCVRAIKDFSIRALYTFWTNVTVKEARSMAVRRAKDDLVCTFRLELPEIEMDTVSWQYNVMMNALRNVLLAPPPTTDGGKEAEENPATVRDAEKNKAMRIEVVRKTNTKEPLDPTRQSCREEIKTLIDEMVQKNLYPVGKRSARTRFVEVYIGRCTWILRATSSASTSALMADAHGQQRVQMKEQMKNVEQMKIEWTGIYATMEFTEDKSSSTVFEVQRMWAKDMDPGKDALSLLTETERKNISNVSDILDGTAAAGTRLETMVLKPELRDKFEHCTWCGARFMLESNHGSACMFHADDEGNMGDFQEKIEFDGNGRPVARSEWSCCGATKKHAVGCKRRPHTGKDIMIRVTAESAPPARVENIDINFLTHCDISVFPTTEYKLQVRVTRSLSEILHDFFKLDAAIDVVEEDRHVKEHRRSSGNRLSITSQLSEGAVEDDKSVVSALSTQSSSGHKKFSMKSVRKMFGLSKHHHHHDHNEEHNLDSSPTHRLEEHAAAQMHSPPKVPPSYSSNSLAAGKQKAGAVDEATAVVESSARQEVLYLRFFRVSGLCIEVSTAGFLVNIPNFRAEMDAYHNNAGNVLLGKDLIKDIESHWIRTVVMNTASSTFHGVYDRIRNAFNADSGQPEWEQVDDRKDAKKNLLLGIGAKPIPSVKSSISSNSLPSVDANNRSPTPSERPRYYTVGQTLSSQYTQRTPRNPKK